MRRNSSNILILILILFVTTACGLVEKIVDPAKTVQKEIATKLYDKDGLRFSYPDNWKVTEDEVLENGLRYVNVEDDDNTVFILSMFTAEDPMDLDEYAENIATGMPEEVSIGKLSEVKKEIAIRMIAGKNTQGIRHKFSISILGEVAPHTRDFFRIDGATYAPIIMIQAPDEDWNAANKEFQVIFDSLKFE